jgi:hypothetical protein
VRVIAVALSVAVGSDRLQGCLAPAKPIDVALVSSSDELLVALGYIRPSSPDVDVRVVGCAGWELERTVDGLRVTPGWTSCAVIAARRDGQLTVETVPIPLDDALLHGRTIALDLPRGPIGGLGVRIVREDGGFRVDEVVAGSPADEAGIVAGSVIREVDGVSTEHLSPSAFVRRATGMPGSRVALEVRDASGAWRSLELVRARIP